MPKQIIPPASEYEAFRAAIAARPYDRGAWEMYIDWLHEAGRLREECVARIALEQRARFGPLKPEDFLSDWRFSNVTMVREWADRFLRLFTRYNNYLARHYRFRRGSLVERRLGPKTGLWEWRMVGPDPRVRPLDCPPNDEFPRRSAWKPYPDEWYAVWLCGTDPSWTDWVLGDFRFRSLSEARSHGSSCRDSSGGAMWYVVRDQDGEVKHHCPAADVRLPENSKKYLTGSV